MSNVFQNVTLLQCFTYLRNYIHRVGNHLTVDSPKKSFFGIDEKPKALPPYHFQTSERILAKYDLNVVSEDDCHHMYLYLFLFPKMT